MTTSVTAQVSSTRLQRAVIVAVVAVWVVKVTIHEIIGMIAVRDGLVAAVGTMPVSGLVSPAIVVGGAFGRISSVHLEPVIIHMTLVRMMHVPVVKVVGVSIVQNSGVTAAGSVLMRMTLVCFVSHRAPPVAGESRGIGG